MEKKTQETLSYTENNRNTDVICRPQCGTSGQICKMTAKLNDLTISFPYVTNLVAASAC